MPPKPEDELKELRERLRGQSQRRIRNPTFGKEEARGYLAAAMHAEAITEDERAAALAYLDADTSNRWWEE